MSLFPLALDLYDHPALVVGAGKVAQRKIRRLLSSGARVRVVSPVALEEVEGWALSGQIEWIRREYHPGDETGYCLVWAMTDDSRLNGEIAVRVKSAGGFCDTATISAGRTMRSLAQDNMGSLLIAATSSPPDPLFSRMIVREMGAMLREEGIETISIEHGCLREALLLEKLPLEEISRVDLAFFRENPDFSDRLVLYGEWFGQSVSDRVRSCVLKRGEQS
ncbi:MAG: bifunctional precorrin-2 dehydrogenase/sirohydrochlorin ferrochelatase [Nitrospiraceae bacterium]|nr:bifunctional precorrin-2 dehydrogenase/sirohydrochlorin ferrochelatase [Nitrospiraceae bacterium]